MTYWILLQVAAQPDMAIMHGKKMFVLDARRSETQLEVGYIYPSPK